MGHNTKRLLIGAVLLGSAVAVAGCSGTGRPAVFSDGGPVTTPITAVRVDVPAAAYRVDAHVGTGKTNLGVAQDPASPNRLDLRVDTGSITVRAA